MRFNFDTCGAKAAVLTVLVVFLLTAASFAQQQVNLTAAPNTLILPDGSEAKMWGYSCGAAVSTSTASCTKLHPLAPGWSPVVITLPSGQDLQINLTNSLPAPVPTSLTIVGQLGGGLGTGATNVASPQHAIQGTTWPIAGDNTGPVFNPPAQGPRVQSFSTEVGTGLTIPLTWKAPRPGTYLMESGTHPSIQGPMGLYGIVVVTNAPTVDASNNPVAGTAYPGVSYNADLSLLLSEIDPAQNRAVFQAVNTSGFKETATIALRDSVSSVAVAVDAAGNPIAGAGYHEGDTVTITGGGGMNAAAQVSSVDSSGAITGITVTNSGKGYSSVPSASASGGSGAQLSVALSLAGTLCSDNAPACYPPAVNYTPLYYLINGVAFDKTQASTSLFAASPALGVSGNVLVRLVNAGLRMHVPSIVGSRTGAPALGGFSLIAEDGNPLPGVARVQSEVFMAAGKTYDVMVNVPAAGIPALPVYDRELSLSGNATNRDAGMLAYVSINGAGLPNAPALGAAQANPDKYFLVPGKPVVVTDVAKGVIANDINIYGVAVATGPAGGTLQLNGNGSFSYTPNPGSTADSFTYCGNGASSGAACAVVTLEECSAGTGCLEDASGIVMNDSNFTSNVATHLNIAPPGILSGDKDVAGYPLTVAASSVTVSPGSGLSLSVDPNGGFNASVPAAGIYTFTYKAQNSQGTLSATSATVTVNFLSPSNLAVTVKDPVSGATFDDFRYIIEEDKTFLVDPTNTTNNCPVGQSCATTPTFGTNFHTSYMPVVAEGCTGPLSCEGGQTFIDSNGMHVPAVCDVGNGVCRPGSQQTLVDPKNVHLDPNKRYYISVLPGDGANPFEGQPVGHTMGGAPIGLNQTAVTVLTEPTPLQPSKISIFVFEDDNPLNGENDAGGGVDVLAPNEPGLGGFNIVLQDAAGGSGDPTGQPTYDMFNMPLTNSLAGTLDPATGLDSCPISQKATSDPNQQGIVGMIVTCPRFESDGKTLSPLAGQAIINNMYPGRYGVVATPGADRIAAGEEWLQTNTLDGEKGHDVFIKVGGPSYFQEYGPAGYHVVIGFANPKIINGRRGAECANQPCNNSISGKVTTLRMSHLPDERLYSSGSRDSFSFTQCYVALGDPDGADIAFTKCDGDGNFTFTGIPAGNWKITLFDQWNDQIVDGLSTPVSVGSSSLCPGPGSSTNFCNMGDVAVQQWHTNIYTRTFFDQNGNGIPDKNGDGSDAEPGLSLVPTNIRFRDGSFSNFNNTDLAGYAGFNEIFPLFNWYVVETDSTRYKNTGTHVVYDGGGPADGSPSCGQSGYPPCGNSSIAQNLANTYESNPVPANLHVPGALYCDNGDCTGSNSSSATPNSTARIDPPWVTSEGWQGFIGQNSFLEFGKAPYAAGENGGIRGHVIYASTRPFDDPQLLLQLSWEPGVPHVTINLYQEGTAPDGTASLKLVDTTLTTSWDDWAQGFRTDGVPNMNCPGQSTSDLFFFTLYNQPMLLNSGNLPNNSQFKCYDGMHNWNQLQPAPYDGMYQFPSVSARDAATGFPIGTNCTICIDNPTGDHTKMLPAGKYVVEVVVPHGYELVKEEDKNILIGDNYIAPVTQQFGGLGSIFILPDQAAIGATYNGNNPQNSTPDLGVQPRHEGDTGSVETFWPCVGASRIVPDFISLFPQSAEVAPFAGASRNLCDRKEITLEDQTSALAKFYVFSSTHVAAHYTGIITDDFSSEFDPFSPAFGEKFSPPNLPVSIKDFRGNEVSRVYSDQWGTFNGLNYSTWEVNPPNPTGYGPTVMVACMNDPGPIAGPDGAMVPDPMFDPAYSQFCYEIPFMPGQTQYMDTPVVPTAAFAEGYNHPDCSYPDATPAIKEVDGDGIGPWVSASGKTLTITALGDQMVKNNAYSGPQATQAPFNQRMIKRHYGFGANGGIVTIGGKKATVTSWSDGQIKVTVPDAVPACSLQQLPQYGGSNAQCGELVITAANGKQSIDAVTVTIGGKAPTVLPAGKTIQAAIDDAAPGDMIILPAGNYNELLLMWKPLRLQGVAAASSVINATAHPSGELKLEPWRRQVNCLFGLALNGQPISPGNKYDPNYDPNAGTGFVCSNSMQLQTDRIDKEGVVGWDTTVNGNLAELLQEPTLMGAYEGAAITVLGKGVRYPAGINPFPVLNTEGGAQESKFPVGTLLLTNNAADCTDYVGNFLCNPSRIDGLSIINSSQGGGGIFVHGWAHNLEISNDRVFNNTGTLTGGVSIGQGEFSDPLVIDADIFNTAAVAAGLRNPGYTDPTTEAVPPRPLPAGAVSGTQVPYGFNNNVYVHHNSITANASYGDELFSSTPAGAGGVTFCTGADYYDFQYNWVCGNLSTGDGGGLAHLGFSYNGDIENNWVLFNQSTNPSVPTNGGGIVIMSTAPDAPLIDPKTGKLISNECGSVSDIDCGPGLSDGTGPNLKINANLIMGNSAESGSGGGLRLQLVNGDEISRFPRSPGRWYDVKVTNNIISNNVAGWDGGGISLQDALKVNIINNTIVGNDTTASSGTLFNTLGAPQASVPPPGCTPGTGAGCTNPVITSTPQVAGVVTMNNTPNLTASFPVRIDCPMGHSSGAGAISQVPNGDCRSISYPLLWNDVIWQNRAFNITVGGYNNQYQQNEVSLVPVLNQPTGGAVTPNGMGSIITGGTGACVGGNYWEIGVRGDSGPSNHGSGFILSPNFSVLSDAADYSSGNNTGSNPQVVSQYCNGSRVPPENGGLGFQVPPGVVGSTLPNPIFNLMPSATVDEGNNFINMSWGPLSLTNPTVQSQGTGNYGGGGTLGDYQLAQNSPAIDYITSSTTAGVVALMLAPNKDYFGNPRPDPANLNSIDVGAVEFQGNSPRLTLISPSSGYRCRTVQVTLTGVNLTGTTAVNVSGANIAVSNVTVVSDTTVTATFTISSGGTLGAKNVTVTTPVGTSNSVMFTVQQPPAPSLSSISPNTGARGTNVAVTLTGSNLTCASAITISGAGVTASGINVVDDSHVTATFAITAGAAITTRTVTLTTLSGTSNTVNFTVQGPTLSSINPTSGTRGTSFPVTFSGTNLAAPITVNGAAGINVTSTTRVNSTTVTANFAVNSGAATGVRNISLGTGIGTTGTVAFTVNAPTLTSIAPNTGVRGTSFGVTLNGSNLAGVNVVTISGSGVSSSNVVAAQNGNSVTANFTITSGAATGARTVTVTNSGGATSNSVAFTVNGPTLATISPTSAFRGVATNVTLTGTNLSAATGLTVVPNSVVITNFHVVNSTTVTATLTFALNAALGARNVAVVTPIGTTNTVTFTVNGPALTSISPTSGARSTAPTVTLTGSNLTGTTAITVSGVGVAVSNITNVDASHVTATFTIAPTATVSTRTVSATTAAGSSNTVSFAVN